MRKGGHATTIVKRAGRRERYSTSTGAWKVAFADFTLAMMALFMVLWIVSSVNEEERSEIVAQLNGTSIFDSSGFKPINHSSSHVVAVIANPHQSEAVPPPESSPSPEALEKVLSRSERELHELSAEIEQITATFNAKDNLSLAKVPQGLRILLQDDGDRMMFPRGSAIMTPFFTQLLTQLAPVFNHIDHRIMISGHTDAALYRSSAHYDNWSLSGDRALAARRVLEDGGLEPQRVMQVNAMADKMPLDPIDPMSARNRRIEIMVLTNAASDTLYQFYGHNGDKVVKPLAEKLK